jgi:hypothetical protein
MPCVDLCVLCVPCVCPVCIIVSITYRDICKDTVIPSRHILHMHLYVFAYETVCHSQGVDLCLSCVYYSQLLHTASSINIQIHIQIYNYVPLCVYISTRAHTHTKIPTHPPRPATPHPPTHTTSRCSGDGDWKRVMSPHIHPLLCQKRPRIC